MNINNAFASKWLKSGDIPEDADLILTMKKFVEKEEIGSGDNADLKPVIYFEEVEKGLALNKTNADSIAKLHGPETDNWIGKRVALFATEVDYQGKQTLAIRVRLKAPKPTSAEAAPATHPPLTYKDALALYCARTGYGEPEFKAALKEHAAQHGYQGYSASRDTEFVYGLIEAQSEEPL